MRKRKQEPLSRTPTPQPPPARTLLNWRCPTCRWSVTSKEAAPKCPKCGAALTPPTDAPLTFRAMDLCDGCGIRLEPGYRLCGLCAACLATSPETAHAISSKSPL